MNDEVSVAYASGSETHPGIPRTRVVEKLPASPDNGPPGSASRQATEPVGEKLNIRNRTSGRVPKWPNGSDCKSDGSAFTGSNPVAPISLLLSFNHPLRAVIDRMMNHSRVAVAPQGHFCERLDILKTRSASSVKTSGALPPNPRDLSLWGLQRGRENKQAAPMQRPLVPYASLAALGSLPSVAPQCCSLASSSRSPRIRLQADEPRSRIACDGVQQPGRQRRRLADSLFPSLQEDR